ncbi:hypothetical protein BU16DRAFT_577806 [Lophium mytilinum]|uniref:Ig-like domain-containing protein n=1 Tax=Lophium mytilinum TaxID=390894 RepID=A0A6A6RBD4_9PEZI|nr:hypothetical protein BU16DRAFT_577806 [Lophium mytilinum]
MCQVLIAISALVVTSHANLCPTCYTNTVPGRINCPLIPALTTPCHELKCVSITTRSIPGPNLACPTTPTITSYGACPTTATCRTGCLVVTTTKTGPSYDCGVSWETGTPSSEASVTFETAATDSAYGTWDERDKSATDATPATSTYLNCIPPPCYTHSVPALLSCPSLTALSPPCVVPECAIITTTTVPGSNPACPTTPTITTTDPCPTTSTCRKGCLIITSTVTAPSWSCAFAASDTSAAAVTWYKRDAGPNADPQIWWGSPKASVSWNRAKRAPEPTLPVTPCVVTTTATIVPPCVPTGCLAEEYLCPLSSDEMPARRDLEAREDCSTATATFFAGCPTCGASCATPTSSRYSTAETTLSCPTATVTKPANCDGVYCVECVPRTTTAVGVEEKSENWLEADCTAMTTVTVLERCCPVC